MKKSRLTIVIAGVLLVTLGMWVAHTIEPLTNTDYLMFGILFIVMAFALFIGIRQFKSERRGEPAEDELSKRIMRLTAARAYYVSLYMWIGVMVYSDISDYPAHTIIGSGIAGMALVFALSWVFTYFKGAKDA